MNKHLEHKIKKDIIVFLKTNEPKDFDTIDDYVCRKLSPIQQIQFSRFDFIDIMKSLLEYKLIADVRKNKYDRHRYISTYAGIKFLRDK
jgi:hypothetical protein